MPDIVKRLRKWGGEKWIPDMAIEAAEEIDRLREALREVIDEFEVCVRTECGSVVASSDEYQPISILLARAALEERK